MTLRTWCVLGVSTIVALAAGCGGSEPAAPTTPPAPVSRTLAERPQWYQECWGYFNDKAWDRFAPCYAENAVSEAIDANPAMVVGRSGIIRQAQTMV
ncbi:MAG: hypothetical protein ACT4QD_23710, partial [Acidobacteriota bacterium]